MYLAAAKRAVRLAARAAVAVQASLVPAAATVKPDRSPVTVGDYAAQALVTASLTASLRRAPRVMAEEDAAALAGGDGALVAAAAAAAAAADPGGGWTAARLVAFISAGGDDGGAGAGAGAGVAVAGGETAGAATDDEAAEADDAREGYWVLDPIDGTKGFLRRGQYAVGLAFVRGGRVRLAAIAAPATPFPSWWAADGATPLGVADGGPGGLAPGGGTLFFASEGGGAWQEALEGGGGGGGEGAGAGAPLPPPPPPQRLRAAASAAAFDAILAESFDPGHSDHGVSAAAAAAAGLRGGAPPGAPARALRLDSMVKYGLIARGDAHVYIRLPREGYAECAWDHAPGGLLVREAGGRVADAAGAPLDFAAGRRLDKNYGVVAAAGDALHGEVVRAVERERAAAKS